MERTSLHRSVVVVGLLAGLTPLIPFAFVDRFVRRLLLRQLYQKVAAEQGRQLPPAALAHLTRIRVNLVEGCLMAVLWWPIKKLIRTVIYFLTVKDCLDEVADATMRGHMVHEALRLGLLPAEASRVGDAMEAALDAHGRSPVLHLLRGEYRAGTGTGSTDPLEMAMLGVAQLANSRAVFADFLRRLGAPPALPAHGPAQLNGPSGQALNAEA
jgi:hypothetical protein